MSGDSAIGVAVVTILAPSPVGYKTLAVPLFNLEPAPGEPARFGFEAEAVPVVVDTAVNTGGDYGVTASVTNATAAAQVLANRSHLLGLTLRREPRQLPRLGVPARRPAEVRR